MIKDLSIILKELRMSHNLSQADVAKKPDISPSIVSGSETGERTPITEKLLALSYFYKCSTDYLLGKSNDKQSVVLDVDGLTTEQIQPLQNLINTIKHE